MGVFLKRSRTTRFLDKSSVAEVTEVKLQKLQRKLNPLI